MQFLLPDEKTIESLGQKSDTDKKQQMIDKTKKYTPKPLSQEPLQGDNGFQFSEKFTLPNNLGGFSSTPSGTTKQMSREYKKNDPNYGWIVPLEQEQAYMKNKPFNGQQTKTSSVAKEEKSKIKH